MINRIYYLIKTDLYTIKIAYNNITSFMQETKNKKPCPVSKQGFWCGVKISQILFLLCFLMILFFFASQEARAACANVSAGGDYTVTASCAFDGTVNGADNGDLIINSGQILTINAGQTIVWNPGKRLIININGAIAINKSGGAQLKKTYLWMVDADNDGYPANLTYYAQDSAPTNGRRRYLMNTISTADINDANACTDSTTTHVCGNPNNTTGTCTPKAAECLSVCTRCNGTSIDGAYLSTAGMVCSGGSEVAPTSANKCDATINCAANACSAATYYRGCTAGSSTCTDTGKVSGTAWNASDGYVINETATGKVATSCTTAVPSASLYCNTANANNNNCQYTTYYRACGGAGSCRTDNTGAASAQATCAAGYATAGATSCTAVTTSNYCQALTNACNGTCQKRTNYYGCNSSGSTCEATVRTYTDSNCASATYCSGGSCVSGYCATCNDCSAGSCVAVANNTQYPGCNSTCQACQSGACSVATAATDPGNQCGTTDCYTGNCKGGTAVCDWYTSGDGACAACKTCAGATSGTCLNYTNNTQDTGCNSTCQACQSGACSVANAGTDPGSHCTTASDCNTGNCKGGTAVCGWYTSGDGACPVCKTCSGATSIACVNYANNTQDATSPNTCTTSTNCQACLSGACTNGAAPAGTVCSTCPYPNAHTPTNTAPIDCYTCK